MKALKIMSHKRILHDCFHAEQNGTRVYISRHRNVVHVEADGFSAEVTLRELAMAIKRLSFQLRSITGEHTANKPEHGSISGQ